MVAAQQDERSTWRELLIAAVGLALVLGSALSYFMSRRLAHWAVEPLVLLSRDVERIDARSPARRRSWSDGDIAEVGAIQRAIDALLGRVESLLQRSERFSRDAAHELLTPLTLISTELQLVAEDEGDASQIDLTATVERLHQLSKLVDGLLLLASDEETLRSNFEAVSLDECVDEVLNGLGDVERARVEFESGAEGLVSGEPELIRGAVRNGIINALKFSTSEIRVSIDESDEHVRVHIHDDGPGVPEGLRSRVLDPFFRIRADETPGHGIGLAIVAHVMKVHRGSVHFEDSKRGAHLVLTFPRWTAER